MPPKAKPSETADALNTEATGEDDTTISMQTRLNNIESMLGSLHKHCTYHQPRAGQGLLTENRVAKEEKLSIEDRVAKLEELFDSAVQDPSPFPCKSLTDRYHSLDMICIGIFVISMFMWYRQIAHRLSL